MTEVQDVPVLNLDVLRPAIENYDALIREQIEKDKASGKNIKERSYGIPLTISPLNLIIADKVALRGVDKKSEEYQKFVACIATDGVINPINVRRLADGRFVVIDGLHRFEASIDSGRTSIPALYLPNVTGRDVMFLQIKGNHHRMQTKPAQFAKHLKRTMAADSTITQADLAEELKVPQSWISQILGLNKLDEDVAKVVDEKGITLANAYKLSRLEPEEQIEWLDRAKTETVIEFGVAVDKHLAEMNRRSRGEGPQEWAPTPKMRKVGELKNLIADVAEALEKRYSNEERAGVSKDSLEYRSGFYDALRLVMHLDDESVEEQRQKHLAAEAERAAKKAAKGSPATASVRKALGLSDDDVPIATEVQVA